MTDPTTPTTETASVKVRMSPLLMERWTARDLDGNRVTVEWGEPDADGFHEPMFTVNYDDNIAERAAASALSALRAEVEGMDGWRDIWPAVRRSAVLAAIDRRAKAEPEGESRPKTIEEQVDELERLVHPEGRCVACGGGKPYWKHLNGDHVFVPEGESRG